MKTCLNCGTDNPPKGRYREARWFMDKETGEPVCQPCYARKYLAKHMHTLIARRKAQEGRLAGYKRNERTRQRSDNANRAVVLWKQSIILPEFIPEWQKPLPLLIYCCGCGEVIKRRPSRVAKNGIAYCGIICRNKHQVVWNKGKHGHLSPETLKRISESGRGRIPWNKGKKQPSEQIAAFTERRRKMVFKHSNNKVERKLREKLVELGITFEIHKAILGQPDIFIGTNLCIFIDGNFYHAHPEIFGDNDIIWNTRVNKTTGELIPAVTAKEIRARDAQVTDDLRLMGYTVLRFWERDIRRRIKWVIETITEEIKRHELMAPLLIKQ